MAKSFGYEVVERSSTTLGTGDYQLGGPPNSYRSFKAEYANGETKIVYTVRNADNSKWEKNRFGTLSWGSPDTLTRNVVKSTNGDAPVYWTADDWPLAICVVPDQDVQEGGITGWLANVRNGILRYGLWFKQNSPSAGKQAMNIYDGTQDIRLGVVNPTDHTIALDSMPAGAVIDFAGSTAPPGFLLCGGQAVSRATYAVLFAAIGTTYGVGDGVTTFNVPDLRGRVSAGRDDMVSAASRITTGGQAGINGTTLGAAGGAQDNTLDQSRMPVHAHGYSDPGHVHYFLQGDTTPASYTSRAGNGDGNNNFYTSTTSSGVGITIGNAGAGGAHNNVQPTIILNKIISTGGV